MFELQLPGDGHAFHVPAAGSVAVFQGQQFADLDQTESALLRLPDETQAPYGTPIIKAITRVGLAGGHEQASLS